MNNCSICHKTIMETHWSFYVMRGSESAHLESWEVVLIICQECFAKRVFGISKEA